MARKLGIYLAPILLVLIMVPARVCTSWVRRVMAGRNPGKNNRLEAVFAQSPGSIWAVGSYSSGGTDRTLIEHCR